MNKYIAWGIVAVVAYLIFFRKPPAAAAAGPGPVDARPPAPEAPEASPYARGPLILQNIQTGAVVDFGGPNAPPLVDNTVWKPYTPPAA